MAQISKESLSEAGSAKIGLLYDMIESIDAKTDKHGEDISSILAMMQKHPTDCKEKFEKLAKRRKFDPFWTTIQGILGGAGVMLMKIAFWK